MIDERSSKHPGKKFLNSFFKVESFSKIAWHRKPNSGFTLLELMTVLFIIGVLAAIGFISYFGYVEKAKVVTVKNELNMLEKEIYSYTIDHDPPFPIDFCTHPDFLDYCDFEDPWGNAYVYKPSNNPPTPPAERRYRFNTVTSTNDPINTDYDLYSEGRDGQSHPDIDDADSQDDIIRAGDGAYKGFPKGY